MKGCSILCTLMPSQLIADKRPSISKMASRKLESELPNMGGYSNSIGVRQYADNSQSDCHAHSISAKGVQERNSMEYVKIMLQVAC